MEKNKHPLVKGPTIDSIRQTVAERTTNNDYLVLAIAQRLSGTLRTQILRIFYASLFSSLIVDLLLVLFMHQSGSLKGLRNDNTALVNLVAEPDAGEREDVISKELLPLPDCDLLFL